MNQVRLSHSLWAGSRPTAVRWRDLTPVTSGVPSLAAGAPAMRCLGGPNLEV
jgi:hypothetical protein